MRLFHIRNRIFFFPQLVLSNRHLGKQIKRTDRYIFKGKLVDTKALGPVTTGLSFNIHCCQSNQSTSQNLNRKSHFWWEQSTTTPGTGTHGKAHAPSGTSLWTRQRRRAGATAPSSHIWWGKAAPMPLRAWPWDRNSHCHIPTSLTQGAGEDFVRKCTVGTRITCNSNEEAGSWLARCWG